MRSQCESTLVQTADGKTTVVANRCRLHGVIIKTNTNDDVAVLVEDDSAEKLILTCAAADNGKPFMFPASLRISSKLNVTVTGTSGKAYILTENNG